MLYQLSYLQSAAMCVSCCSQAFWAHEYNTPLVVRLADYLTDLCDPRASCEAHVPLGLRVALACEAQTEHATLSDTRWRVGFARPDGTTRFLFQGPRSLTFRLGGQTPVLCLALASRLEPPLGKTTRRLWRPGELA